ncbi:MAG: recombinase family protein [Microthrixaceae bacterium]
MLTVAYCRVSTEEQANEGYSIEGQAQKLRAYAELHELGEVTLVTDAGLSGKNMDRPGLQQIRSMASAGHLSNVLLYRLDRLSRDLGDLILLADEFGAAGVGLHSVHEKLDLGSATGRMFFHIIGAFAQFYREQLAENVTMGMAQARAQGRWTNRPPTGYKLTDGLLVPNEHASTVRRIFAMRGENASYKTIAEATGINHSTVLAILKNRAYIGEMGHKGEWFPGIHEPLITEAEFIAAHRGRIPGRKRGKDLLSGKVICGTCGRKMSIESNGQGQHQYRCKHRGEGCKLSGRSNRGLLAAVVLALELLCDEELRDAIRRHLDERRQPDPVRRRRTSGAAKALEALHTKRNKLLGLYYEDKISSDQFGEEQARLTTEIDNLTFDSETTAAELAKADEVAVHFEHVVEVLDKLNLSEIWDHATEAEQRTIVDEMLDNVTISNDCLAVTLHGAPSLNVAFSEVGLKDSDLSGVGGGT